MTRARPLFTEALIALGSNLGDRAQFLRGAIAQLDALPTTRVLRASRFHDTAPVGPAQPNYLNAAVLLHTELEPRALLEHLRAIEAAAGRERWERWGPRTLDLDLILFGERLIDTEELTVPHPRAHHRSFVLEPAAEIAPHLRHPRLGCTVHELMLRARSGASAPS